jgi:N-acetylglutamate synthase-like GNAT family acetyltransferase
MALPEVWNMAPRLPSSEQPEVERSGIEIANSFVAESDGRIVGVCSYIMMEQAGWAETVSLAVDPSTIGRGVGSRLQQARLEEMRMRGIRWVRTDTDRPATIHSNGSAF